MLDGAVAGARILSATGLDDFPSVAAGVDRLVAFAHGAGVSGGWGWCDGVCGFMGKVEGVVWCGLRVAMVCCCFLM